MTVALHARARQIRERALIRAWRYRQRHHSNGVWFRLRRTLVDAELVFVVSEGHADQLEAEGQVPLPIGQELEPRKRIFVVSEQQLADMPNLRSLPIRLSSELLEARSLVLVPFSGFRCE